jgi:hypothetical protein
MKTRNIAWLALVLVILGTILSACGPSPEEVYLQKMTGPMENYSAKVDAFGTAFGNWDYPNGGTDPAQLAQLNTAMDELDKAAGELGNISTEVPESYKTFDGYLKEVAGETLMATTATREALVEFNAGDNEAFIKKIEGMIASTEKIVVIMDKMDAELNRLNPK